MAGHIRSDRERKAMFSNMNNPNSNERTSNPNNKVINSERNPNDRVQRKVVMGSGHTNNQRTISEQSNNNQPTRLPKNQRDFISDEISRQRREGKPQDQAIAIAFSKARKEFGNKGLIPKVSNPNGKETERLLRTLLGVAVALAIIKSFKKKNNLMDKNNPNKESKKKAIKEFEQMRNLAEFKALSKISLERQLSDKEFKRFKELGKIVFKNNPMDKNNPNNNSNNNPNNNSNKDIRISLNEIKRLRNKAIKENKKQFFINGQPVLVSFAKFWIPFIESEIKRKGIRENEKITISPTK